MDWNCAKAELMASSLSKPVEKRFALGSDHGPRTPVVSIVTVLRSALAILSCFGLACHDVPEAAGIDCSKRPIRIGVASSLREVALSLRLELRSREQALDTEMIFGASNILARQLALGAPIDILVSADAEIVDDLTQRGLLTPGSAIEFARGRLALLARADWPPGISGLAALGSSALRRVALPSPSVPLGRYARFWLDKKGLLGRLEGKIVTTEHARATLSAVDAGHVDLAIVYESDARLARRAVVLARIEPSEYPPIRYLAARAAAAPSCPSIDEALAAWADPFMHRQLAVVGFLPAPSTKAVR
jgi:molybdate transport system substrate-binding protein